jgi:alkylhydroperoxidase/carboxymuconolactone decarboxylase family protein YurZ
MDEQERYAAGMKARRAVLGDAHVDRSAAKLSDPMQSEFQELITRYAWGEIWTRPGLPRHTRSLLTIAMMVALNRGEELRLHQPRSKKSCCSALSTAAYPQPIPPSTRRRKSFVKRRRRLLTGGADNT